MKRTYILGVLVLLSLSFKPQLQAATPDSAYIFSYATTKNGAHNGLHFAWSTDRNHWHTIGPEYSFLKSDYGPWGAEKRMYDPFLFLVPGGLWHCVWSLNDRDGTFAHASSPDLISWRPQSYPDIIPGNNCLKPEISFDRENQKFEISWVSDKRGRQYYRVESADLIHYTPVKTITQPERLQSRESVAINGEDQVGTVHKVAWNTIEKLIDHQKLVAYNQQLYHETTDEDPQRFAGLNEVKADITVDMNDHKPISDELIGVFFEDINYAADGGLYAELVQNRDFEYSPSDRKGRDPNWNSYYAWKLKGKGVSFNIDTVTPVHINNPHYAVLKVDRQGAALVNEGFDGISLKAGEKYNFSMFGKVPRGSKMKVAVRLTDSDGTNIGQTVLNIHSSDWKKVSAVIRVGKDAANARLELVPQQTGEIGMDMISLFPQNTFKGRKNGLRADLAQLLADLKPQFVRFPGGCVAHGDGLGNIYHWKNTIGLLESRKSQRNIWNYHQSMGLGFYEYFQFCEDIDAEPVPIVAAGVPCQNSSCGGAGQQGGIPMNEMDAYIQDILDLIEWANGDKNTEWGRKRAEAGHPKPFHLKYLGVGNEDLITHIFEERFEMIYKAVHAKYPDIVVIGTVGPFSKGSDYDRGWEFARELKVPMVDEHYYQPPGWFIHNQDFYDKYDRSAPKVYLGEYAAHLPGRPRNIETALAEALYLTSVERNGDVVHMASYAPLLAREGHTQWNPDLIYFNNTEVKPSVGYFVQKLFGQNSGDTYYTSTVELSDNRQSVSKRVTVSVVRDSKSNDLIVKLVNLLPIDVNAQLNLQGVDVSSSKARCTVLSGAPNATDARPVTNEISVGNDFDCVLPAYSFTVIRIDGEQPGN